MSNRPIIGNTVGTPVSAAQVERELKPVKTVNNVTPDENGNVNVDLPEHVKTVNNMTPDENGNVDTPDRHVVSARKEFVRMPNTGSMVYKIVLEMSEGEPVEVELPSIPNSALTPEDYIILSDKDPSADTEAYTAQMLVNTQKATIWLCTQGNTPEGRVYPKKWLNIAGGTVDVDATLTQSGMAADAKAVGDAIGQLSEAIGDKLDANKLPEAINTALAQAKESGEFDGEDGVSITSVKQTTTSSADDGVNIVTVTLSDGQTATFEVKNGSKGSAGKDGVNGAAGNGIKSVALNADYTLTLTFTDGTSYTTPSSIRGATGTAGKDGQPGQDGKPGVDGFSPTVSVAAIIGGHRITITDKNSTKTVDVMDGADGTPGENGNPGRGITSIARTSGTGAAGTTDTYTITYTDGTTSTFGVYNGKNGAKGDPGDNYILTDADRTEIAQKAYDQFPDWAKQPEKPTYTKSEVGLGNVDNVRQYSTSNPPPYPVTSVNGQTGGVTVTAAGIGAATTGQLEELAGTIADKADKNNVALYITPEMYGAIGDGETDDSVAIQAAIDAAYKDKKNIVYLGKKTYKTTKTIEIIHSYQSFVCEGTISYAGTGAAVVVGSKHIDVDIHCINAPDGTALKVAGSGKYIEFCRVNVDEITSCKIGLHIYTDTVAISYNQFRIGYINASEIGVSVEAMASFINENWYYLGKITGCNIGVKLYSDSSLDSSIGMGTNDNRFFSGSFEGIATEGCAIFMENSSGNKFEHLRCAEYYGKNSIIIRGFAKANDIGLSRIYIREVDISGHTGGNHNVLRSDIIGDTLGGYVFGTEARIDAMYGITYNPSSANIDVDVQSTTFAGNVIKQVNTAIPTSLYFKYANADGSTFTLSDIYSGTLSMARGFPVCCVFGESAGKILLQDSKGDSILDNRSGEYAGKTVSVRWNGYDKDNGKNIWEVLIVGDKLDLSDYAKKSDHYTKTESDNKYQPKGNYLTSHQDISGKADKSNAETWTFTLSDGTTVTKKVVLA